MIYLAGMSHMQSVINAAYGSDNIFEKYFTNHSWRNNLPIKDQQPQFINLGTDNLINKDLCAVSIHSANFQKYWGHTLAELTDENMLAVAPGFQNLLSSIKINSDNVLVLFIQGEEYFMMGANYQEPYDFFLSTAPELRIQPNRQIIPLGTVERLLNYHLKRAKAIFYAIRFFLPNLQIINCLCPPPIPERLLIDWFSPKLSLPESFKNEIFRIKLYTIYINKVQEITNSLGFINLIAPDGTSDELGLLKPEYCTPNDNVHGNIQYGKKVLDQIIKVLNN
jgi:hypothetical protein